MQGALLSIQFSNAPPFLEYRFVISIAAHMLDGQSKESAAGVAQLPAVLFLVKGQIPRFV
jgi:hypothetical protein